SGETPLFLRYSMEDSAETTIIPIEDLWETVKGNILISEKGEEIKTVPENLFCYNGKWTKIIHIIRHKYKGQVLKITTKGGCIEVTPNHSLVYSNGKIAKADKLRVGDLLAMPFFDLVKLEKRGFFIGTEEFAWFCGLFAAEGSIHGVDRQSHGQSVPQISISNSDKELLLKASKIVETNFNKKPILTYDRGYGKQRTPCWRLWIQGWKIKKYFKDNFYTLTGKKKVPDFILNAPKNIRIAFLKGYDAGDGVKKKREGMDFEGFCTNSQVLASGLLYLINRKDGYGIQTRQDKPTIVEIRFNKYEDKWVRKERNEITKIFSYDYDGYVYDVETEKHVFAAGVGPILAHNTEMYVRIESDLDISHKHIQYIHFPTENLMPVYGKEPKHIWTNSTFSQSWIRIRWGYSNPNYTKTDDKYVTVQIPKQIFEAQIVNPPIYVDDYRNECGFSDRRYDVVMFARLGEDKFTVADFLDKQFRLLSLGASSPLKPFMEPAPRKGVKQVNLNAPKPMSGKQQFQPKGELHKNLTFDQIKQFLKQAKVYVHSKGFGLMQSGGVSEPEHFGISIIEAMASGCAAIVPRTGGCWSDISLLGKYTLAYSSLEELKANVERLARNRNEWEKWHNLALEGVQRFDAENAKKRIKELLG
ncbi:glycosyltransferase, partial [Candidatus Bathyarchaeota archaeon]|nr:glycosyltransferase [Candidatus Bathyarchaeota archaeon]